MSTAATRDAILRGDYYERHIKPLVREDKVRPPFRSQDWGPKMDSILAKHERHVTIPPGEKPGKHTIRVGRDAAYKATSGPPTQDDIYSLLGEQS